MKAGIRCCPLPWSADDSLYELHICIYICICIFICICVCICICIYICIFSFLYQYVARLPVARSGSGMTLSTWAEVVMKGKPDQQTQLPLCFKFAPNIPPSQLPCCPPVLLVGHLVDHLVDHLDDLLAPNEGHIWSAMKASSALFFFAPTYHLDDCLIDHLVDHLIKNPSSMLWICTNIAPSWLPCRPPSSLQSWPPS